MNSYLGIAVYVVFIVAAIAATIIVIGLFALFLNGWPHRRRRRVREADQLKWLDELAKEHEYGKRDNRDMLEIFIRTIEDEHKRSAALTKRLENVRRILERTQSTTANQTRTIIQPKKSSMGGSDAVRSARRTA